jgi:hypothetical protein
MQLARVGSAVLVMLGALAIAPAAAGADPHASFTSLPFGNGYGFGVWDASQRKLVTLTEHPYKATNATTATRDVAYDAYFGARANGAAGWLSESALDAVAYEAQSAVVHATQHQGPLTTESYVFSPWKLAAPSVVLALKVTNSGTSAVSDAAAFGLVNLHLGNGAPRPDSTGEHVTYAAASDAFTETGASGLTAHYLSLSPTSFHTASPTGPSNPYSVVKGGADLVPLDDSGVVNDAVAGFEWSMAGIKPGETRWVGVVVTLGSEADARAWWASRTPDALVAQELADWESYRVAPPAGLSAAETRVFRQAETVLRVAQSREPAPSAGQLVAALPPGQWWISWVRDMSYATAALARMGHAAEANAAVDFFKHAKVGGYETEVGVPYSISVVRYFGDGEEESDSNTDGPNIEFDGFGLAPWAAHLAGRSDLDDSARTLTSLLDPTGLVKADSSIWEVHWNGKQRRFAYTSAAAARGLCSAGMSMPAAALRDAIVKNLVGSDGAIHQSYEALGAGTPSIDAAAIEAINFGLIDPAGPTASATFAAIDGALKVPSGHGYMRNQDGGTYDSAEWLFIDLRVSDALRRMGKTAAADALLGWVTAQADLNHDLIPELFDRTTGDYSGSIPMVGFGAGAYILTLLDRASPPTADPCFFPDAGAGGSDAGASDASASDAAPGDASAADAGVDGESAGSTDASSVTATNDGSVDAAPPVPTAGTRGCSIVEGAPHATRDALLATTLAAFLALGARRRRADRGARQD